MSRAGVPAFARSNTEEAAAAERFYGSLVEETGLHARVLHLRGETASRDARALLARREAAARRMAARYRALVGGRSRESGPVRFVLFPTLEVKMRVTGASEEAGVDPLRPDLVPIVQGGDPGLEDLAHARALARDALAGEGPVGAGLEWGIAVHLNGSWKGRPPAVLSARLAAAGVLPSLASVLLPQQEESVPLSPLCLGPAAGAFVDFAASRMGAEAFVRAASQPAAVPEMVGRLLSPNGVSRRAPRVASTAQRDSVGEPGGHERQGGGTSPMDDAPAPGRAVASRGSEAVADRLPALESAWRGSLPAPAPPPARTAPGGFHHGACLAHTNSIEGGYGGEALTRTLDALVSRGVDWISISPFAFQRGPDATRIRFILSGSGAETDEVVRNAIRQAHERGIKVLYNPHLWVGHRSWSGEIEASDEAGWSDWFTSYRAYIVHHALLAEEEKAEIFCVANELGRTVGRQRQWRDTIAAVRRVFGGPLTYAANWGDEAESVAFWDALDFVGINTYYPLSESPGASDTDLAAGARAGVDRLVRIGRSAARPVLLTEVGFASRPGCWIDPYREVREAPADTACQARAYAAILGVIAGEPLRGLYWWKFESDPVLGGPGDNSFTPRGKPAEQIMSEAYRRRRPGRASEARSSGGNASGLHGEARAVEGSASSRHGNGGGRS